MKVSKRRRVRPPSPRLQNDDALKDPGSAEGIKSPISKFEKDETDAESTRVLSSDRKMPFGTLSSPHPSTTAQVPIDAIKSAPLSLSSDGMMRIDTTDSQMSTLGSLGSAELNSRSMLDAAIFSDFFQSADQLESDAQRTANIAAELALSNVSAEVGGAATQLPGSVSRDLGTQVVHFVPSIEEGVEALIKVRSEEWGEHSGVDLQSMSVPELPSGLFSGSSADASTEQRTIVPAGAFGRRGQDPVGATWTSSKTRQMCCYCGSSAGSRCCVYNSEPPNAETPLRHFELITDSAVQMGTSSSSAPKSSTEVPHDKAKVQRSAKSQVEGNVLVKWLQKQVQKHLSQELGRFGGSYPQRHAAGSDTVGASLAGNLEHAVPTMPTMNQAGDDLPPKPQNTAKEGPSVDAKDGRIAQFEQLMVRMEEYQTDFTFQVLQHLLQKGVGSDEFLADVFGLTLSQISLPRGSRTAGRLEAIMNGERTRGVGAAAAAVAGVGGSAAGTEEYTALYQNLLALSRKRRLRRQQGGGSDDVDFRDQLRQLAAAHAHGVIADSTSSNYTTSTTSTTSGVKAEEKDR